MPSDLLELTDIQVNSEAIVPLDLADAELGAPGYTDPCGCCSVCSIDVCEEVAG